MNAQQLKVSIIQQAIEGKLVSQRSSEIAIEQIGDSPKDIPFTIPKNWKWVQLKHIVQSNIGLTYKPSQVSTTGTPVLRSGNIQDGEFVFDHDLKRLSLTKIPEKCLINDGDILICARNGSRRLVGKCALVRNLPEPCAFGAFMAVIRSTYSEYIKLFLESPFFKKSVLGDASTTTINQLTQKMLMEAWCPLPPKEEQDRIVSKVEKLLPLIEAYGKSYDRLQKLNAELPRKLKASILQEAIQGKLVPQLESEEPVEQIGSVPEDVPFAIPEKWKWCVLDEIGEFKKGPFGSALTKSMFIPDGPNAVRVYEQRNAIEKDSTFARYFISREYYESKMKSFTVLSGDLIVSCAGTIGEIYILPEDAKEGIINQALMRVRLTNVVTREYFKLVFSSLIKDLCIAESGGTAIKNIPPFKIFKQFPIPVPPIQEQNRIVQKVYDLIEQVDSLVGKKIMS